MRVFAGIRAVLAAGVALGAIATTGRADAADERPSEAPMVFVWRVDNENSALKEAAGSGFLLGADGIILTAKHVADHNDFEHLAISIGSKNANPVPAQTDIDCDQVYDFCFLRILAADVTAASIDPGTFYGLRCRAIGEEAVLAYGFLGGNNGVSHARGETTTGTIDEGMVMTSADLEHSMSGGPVFDAEGHVIAIVKGGALQQSAIQPIRTAASYFPRHGHSCPDGTTAGEVVVPDAAALAGIWQDKDGGSFFLGRNGDGIAIDGRAADGRASYSGIGTIKGTDLAFEMRRRGVPVNDRLSFTAYSGRCINPDDKGCTVESDPACATPPSYTAFDPDTAVVATIASEGVDVPEPCRFTQRKPDMICAIAHAESGSGFWRKGHPGSRTCQVSVALTGRDLPPVTCTGALVSPTMIMASCAGADGALYPWILISDK